MHHGSLQGSDANLMSSLAPIGSPQMLEIGFTGSKKPDLSTLNVMSEGLSNRFINGLNRRWICGINAVDLGNLSCDVSVYLTKPKGIGIIHKCCLFCL